LVAMNSLYNEFIATKTRNLYLVFDLDIPESLGLTFDLSRAVQQAPRQFNQKPVARRVSQAIVDHFEFIYVDEKYRNPSIASHSRSHGLAQTIYEEEAVGESGQPVVKSIMRKQVFRAFPVRDVAVHDHQPVLLTVRPFNGTRGGFQNPPASITVLHPVFEAL